MKNLYGILTAGFLYCSTWLSYAGSANLAYSAADIDIKKLSAIDAGSLERHGIVKLQKIIFGGENNDNKFEHFIGFTLPRKSRAGYCVYDQFYFEKLPLIEDSSGLAKSHYIAVDAVKCELPFDGRVVEADSVSDAIAVEIVSLLEEAKSDLRQVILFPSSMPLNSSEIDALLKKMQKFHIRSIGRGNEGGEYQITFADDHGETIELLVFYSSSALNVIESMVKFPFPQPNHGKNKRTQHKTHAFRVAHHSKFGRALLPNLGSCSRFP